MVDCRLCKNAYKIWSEYLLDDDKDRYKIVCLVKEKFIPWKQMFEGPCDLYVDVDCDLSGNGDL